MIFLTQDRNQGDQLIKVFNKGDTKTLHRARRIALAMTRKRKGLYYATIALYKGDEDERNNETDTTKEKN